jgi:hypothetical protein
MAYLSAAVLGAFVCLLSAALVPMITSLDPRLGSLQSGTVLDAYRNPHSIDHPVRLTAAPDLVLTGGIVVADAAAAARGITRLIVDRPEFLLRLSPADKTAGGPTFHSLEHGDLPDVVGPLLRQLHGFKVDQVQIRGGTLAVVWQGGRETVTRIDAEVSGLAKGSISGAGRLTYRGQPFAVEASFASQPSRETAGQQAPARAMKVLAKSPIVAVAFEGMAEARSSPVLRGAVDLTGANLSELAAWLGSPALPAQTFRDVALRGEMIWADGVVAIDKASVALNGQAPATGVVSLSRSATRPQVEATLAFDVLDLASFLPADKSGANVAGLAENWREISLEVPFADTLRADVRVSASPAALNGNHLGKAAMSVTVAEGKLLVDVAEIEHPGGRTSGQVTIDAASGRTAARGRIDTANLGPILSTLAGVDLLTGRGAMQVDLSASARDIGQFISTAEGRVTIVAGPQAQFGADLLSVRAALAESRHPAWLAVSKASPQIDALEARSVLQNGRLHIDSASLRFGPHALSATGSLNPRSREMDLLLGLRESKVGERGRVVGQVDPSRFLLLRGLWSSPQVLPPEPAPNRP